MLKTRNKKSKIDSDVMKTVSSVFPLLCLLFIINNCKSEDIEKDNTDNNPYEFHIGGVLSSNASEGYFKQTIEVIIMLYNNTLYLFIY